MKGKKNKNKSFWSKLGPGLITGASDDDPSGIATYSQVGASYGLTALWTALLTFPLMASVQEMCARIGIITAEGLTGTLKKHYSPWVLYLMLLFSVPAIILNIGADIASMGAVGNLLFPSIKAEIFSVAFTLLLLYFMIYFSYRKFAAILKFLCLILLVYIIVPFLFEQDFTKIITATFIPKIEWNEDFLNLLVAILGTTISPYLFFWQASMEAEEVKQNKKYLLVNKKIIDEMRVDIDTGMLFSNVVMFFIILTSGTVLYNAGIHHINTVEEAASALKPLAGQNAYLLFSIGIIGTGCLAIPVLSGSVSYIFAETFGFSNGFDKKYHEAKAFYIIIAISLLLGLSLNYIGITPIQALIYSAVLYGLTAPVIIGIILHICNNKKVMGENKNGLLSNVLGTTTMLFMTAAAIALLYFLFK